MYFEWNSSSLLLVFSALVCQKRGAASYAKNRVARILLPLTLCVIFIHPWIAGEMWIDLQAGNQSVISTYLEFISSPTYILTKGRPVGGWLWHFWFLHVLCYLIGIYLALHLALRNSQRSGRARQWLTKRLHRPLGILYLIIPTFAVLTFSPPWADVPKDWNLLGCPRLLQHLLLCWSDHQQRTKSPRFSFEEL